MEIDPKDFLTLIAAPPVVLVSTLHGEVANLAPFGMVMPTSHEPPMLALGIKGERHTFDNIQKTGEFVVAVPGPDLIKQMEITARPIPREVSEFAEAGLTPEKSRAVKPFRVAECQANFECRLVWAKEAGSHNVVVGQVVAASIKDGLRQTGTREDVSAVYYLGSNQYARRGARLEK